MKTIELTQGLVALVDDADFDSVNQYNWCAQNRKHGFHAARYEGKKYVYLHRFLMPGVEAIDHKDGDGLNNQRTNLRPASKRQNAQAFQYKREGKTSRFRGVCWHPKGQKWMARIQLNKKGIYLGIFVSESDAARAYDVAAKQHFREFASPNFPV